MSINEADDIKCVVVGDGAVGKTSLLISYTTGKYPKEYIPTVFDNYEFDKVIDDKSAHVRLWDTAGQEEYDHIRPLSYPDTDIFLVCFSIDSDTSFRNVKSRWLPELKEHAPNTPFILIGTKCDLREDDALQTRSYEELESAANNDLGAKGYIECSALSRTNLDKVFEDAVKTARVYKEELEQLENNKENNQTDASGGGGCCIVN